MKSKNSLQRPLIISSIVGVACYALIIFLLNPDLFVSKNLFDDASAKLKEPVRAGLPLRIQIPKIRVDASVEHVGLTAQGVVGVPKGPTTVAWFDLGPRPGEKGSSIISGHYGWTNNKPAVFDNLYKLRKGDKLYITDDKGLVTTFIVRESRRYDPKGDASNVFASLDGKPHLNLITCEGIWNKFSKSYSKRLVIFTDKEI